MACFQCFKIQREKLAKRLAEKTFADSVIFQNSGAELQKQQLKLREDIFTQLVKNIKIELFIKIHSMEEQLQQYMQVVQKK